MTLTQALGLGILQGATEFLPVSSSGHLVLARSWISTHDGSVQLLFDVIVHLGTLGAIAVVLRRRLWALIRAGLSYLPTRERPAGLETDRRWIALIVLGSVPTAAIGLALHDGVKRMQLEPGWVGVALLVTAALLVVSERFGSRRRAAGDLGVVDALTIGVVQGFGVLPGISRSGATIAAALGRGLRAEVAVEFSVLLSVPAVLGAVVLEASAAGLSTLRDQIEPLAVGLVAAFVTGVLSLRALQWVVAQRKLVPVAVYCGLVGAGAMIYG